VLAGWFVARHSRRAGGTYIPIVTRVSGSGFVFDSHDGVPGFWLPRAVFRL